MPDPRRVFEQPSRARNMRELPWTGDPERWGGSGAHTFTISAAGGPILFFGNQLIRAQTQDLIAVGWDLIAAWDVPDFDLGNDTIQVAMEFSIGTGQTTSQLLWDLGLLSPAVVTPNPQATALGWHPRNDRGGVAISGSPIVATAINARWFCQISTVAVAAHDVHFSINAHCAPRGWAP